MPLETEGKNILIVDDDDGILDLYHELLTGEGHVVTMAKNGLDGLRKIEEKNFDIIITDLEMPNLGGIELIDFDVATTKGEAKNSAQCLCNFIRGAWGPSMNRKQ